MTADTAPALGCPREEFDYRVEEVHGAIPASLRGVLYRIGPGRLKVGELRFGHIFDGDGMISRFEFSDDGVSFRNRYVRTKHFAMASSTWIGRGIGTQRFGRLPRQCLPDAVQRVEHQHRLARQRTVLIVGGRSAVSIDPETLETRGTETFDGTLKHMGAFCAPEDRRRNGEMFNFGLEMFPRPMLRTFCRDAHGRMKVLAPVKLSRPVLCHDFALTEHYLVFPHRPHRLQPTDHGGARAGPMDHRLSFEGEAGTRVVLVPRDGGKPRVVDTEALFHFHNANAWRRTATSSSSSSHIPPRRRGIRPTRPSATTRTTSPGLRGRMERLRITGNRVTHEHLADVECEFPQPDQRFATRLTRPRMWLRRRCPAGNRTHWSASITRPVGRTCSPSPPATPFASRSFAPDPETDGGGWLLSVEHLADEARSRLLVLDAEHLADGPIASAELTNHIPMGFHGTFVPAASSGAPTPHRFGNPSAIRRLAAWW